MIVSSYQINNVIKTYMKNMVKRVCVDQEKNSVVEDSVSISEDGVKRMLLERIEENVSERSGKYQRG